MPNGSEYVIERSQIWKIRHRVLQLAGWAVAKGAEPGGREQHWWDEAVEILDRVEGRPLGCLCGPQEAREKGSPPEENAQDSERRDRQATGAVNPGSRRIVPSRRYSDGRGPVDSGRRGPDRTIYLKAAAFDQFAKTCRQTLDSLRARDLDGTEASARMLELLIDSLLESPLEKEG